MVCVGQCRLRVAAFCITTIQYVPMRCPVTYSVMSLVLSVRFCLQPELHSWEFEPWNIRAELLPAVLPSLLRCWNLLEPFAMNDDTVLAFARAVQCRYTRRNSFHNFYHAVSVLQVL